MRRKNNRCLVQRNRQETREDGPSLAGCFAPACGRNGCQPGIAVPPYSHPAGPSACLWLSADDRSEPASTTCPLGSNRERLGLIPMFQKIETSSETGFAAGVQAFASRLAGVELRRIGGDALHCLAVDMGALSVLQLPGGAAACRRAMDNRVHPGPRWWRPWQW